MSAHNRSKSSPMLRSEAKPAPRKSLGQALKDLLRRGKNVAASSRSDEQIFGSGILRKAPSSIPRLPNFSTVSVFPDFGDLDNGDGGRQSVLNSISIPSHCSNAADLMPSTTTSRMLPQPSLSSFGLRRQYCDFNIHHKVIFDSVPEQYQRGASRQGSIISVAAFSGMDSGDLPSASPTRFCDSKPSIRSGTYSQTDGLPRSYKITSTLRRPTSVVWIQPGSHAASMPSTPRSESSQTTSDRDGSLLEMIEHFKCFCVLDTGQAGCPVTATSMDLRYVFEVGEKFVLNNRECEGSSMGIVSGVDAAGEEIVHLVLFSPLVIPSSGRSRYMLVSLIDVTDFIRESANRLPELDAISEEASFTEGIATPPSIVQREPQLWSECSYHLSADDLLGGCSVAEDPNEFLSSNREANEDVWLALAKSEGGLKSNRSRRHTFRASCRTPTPTRTTTSSHVSDATDEILEDFMKNLQHLYSDFFLLGQSPLSSNAYEMCNVSPSVYASQEWVDGHLSHTSSEVIAQLSEHLGQNEPFFLKIHWGVHGQAKQMYCSPLYGGSSITWICYLVDERTIGLW